MRENPFASLISVDEAGFPFVSHIPLHLEVSGDALVLWGHVAKPNVHWRYLAARPQALVTFLGPHAYLSPRVYPDLTRVPTWNYLAVHCQVTARLVEAPDEKDDLLKKLIGEHEPAYAAQWRGLGEDYQHKMLAGIVGFELTVTEVQCKLKLNQHRPEATAATLALYSQGGEKERALVRWMALLGMTGSPPSQT
jgi:transcriptional regulator